MNKMELSFNLLTDMELFLVFIVLAITIHHITLYLFQGLAGFHILNLRVLAIIFDPFSSSPEILLLYTPPFLLFVIVSWMCSEFIAFFSSTFNLADIGLVSVGFCACVFLFMAYTQASFIRFEFNFNEGETSRVYYEFSWEGLDSSLTPAIISTLLILPGMLIAYYH
jgi:hypothetical protein